MNDENKKPKHCELKSEELSEDKSWNFPFYRIWVTVMQEMDKSKLNMSAAVIINF